MKNCVIYKITNPSNHSYVGQSMNWDRRYNQYKRLACKEQKALYASFLKYGFENHTFEILMQEIPETEINSMERLWISVEGTFGPNGLNLTEGGDGFKGKHSKETRQKQSNAKK